MVRRKLSRKDLIIDNIALPICCISTIGVKGFEMSKEDSVEQFNALIKQLEKDFKDVDRETLDKWADVLVQMRDVINRKRKIKI